MIHKSQQQHFMIKKRIRAWLLNRANSRLFMESNCVRSPAEWELKNSNCLRPHTQWQALMFLLSSMVFNSTILFCAIQKLLCLYSNVQEPLMIANKRFKCELNEETKRTFKLWSIVFQILSGKAIFNYYYWILIAWEILILN